MNEGKTITIENMKATVWHFPQTPGDDNGSFRQHNQQDKALVKKEFSPPWSVMKLPFVIRRRL